VTQATAFPPVNTEKPLCTESGQVKLPPATAPVSYLPRTDTQKHTDIRQRRLRNPYSHIGRLEQTVEELSKCFLLEFGENKEFSYGRCRKGKSFDDLYEGLNSIN
jgi:hypothetical protein